MLRIIKVKCNLWSLFKIWGRVIYLYLLGRANIPQTFPFLPFIDKIFSLIFLLCFEETFLRRCVLQNRRATRVVLWKKVFSEISQKFTGKYLCQSLFFNKVPGQALAQVFSCEFCEISKKMLFTEHLRTTASDSLTSLFILKAHNKIWKLTFS